MNAGDIAHRVGPWIIIVLCLLALVRHPDLYTNPAFVSILSAALLAAKVPGNG